MPKFDIFSFRLLIGYIMVCEFTLVCVKVRSIIHYLKNWRGEQIGLDPKFSFLSVTSQIIMSLMLSQTIKKVLNVGPKP